MRRAIVSAAALAAAGLLSSGCVSVSPFDGPTSRHFVRGASTGPHVFFAAVGTTSAELALGAPPTEGQVMVYDLEKRAARPVAGGLGAFAATGDELVAVKGENLVRLRPGSGGKLERAEVVATGMGPDVRRVVPAGEGRVLVGRGRRIEVVGGPLAAAEPVYQGDYLDFAYDQADDTAWVIASAQRLDGIALATPRAAVRSIALPREWVRTDPIVAGARYLVVFERMTETGRILVVDKQTGRTSFLDGHIEGAADRMPGGLGPCDVAHLDGDRFLVARSDEDRGAIYEVDLAGATIEKRHDLPEPILSLVPDPEGLVVGTRSKIYWFDSAGRVADVRKFDRGNGFARGAAKVGNGVATVGANVGVVGVVAVGVATLPIWLPILFAVMP